MNEVAKKFKVIVTSFDNHKFEYTIDAKDEFEAAQKAYKAIDVNGWSNHRYMVDEVIEMKDEEK